MSTSTSRAQLVLRVLTGQRAGTELSVVQGAPLRIGRAADCQVRPQNDRVSRHHSEIFYGLAGFMVKDCGSRCGTFVDDRRIEQPTLLRDGQQLRVGPYAFLIVLPREAAAGGDHAADAVVDADICRWLDEPGEPTAPRSDESAIFRRELKMDERSCDAAEQALMHIKKRSSRS